MPGVDVRRKDKNQRKFSGEEAQTGQLDLNQQPGLERKQTKARIDGPTANWQLCLTSCPYRN